MQDNDGSQNDATNERARSPVDDERAERLLRDKIRKRIERRNGERREERLLRERESKRNDRKRRERKEDRRVVERMRMRMAVQKEREAREDLLEPLENIRKIRENPSLAPLQPTPAMVQETSERFSRWFSSDHVVLGVCAVCNQHKPKVELTKQVLQHGYGLLEAMQMVLAPRPDMTDRQREEYDCSEISPVLAGMLLSKQGCSSHEGGAVQVSMCQQCSDSLGRTKRAMERDDNGKLYPPKLAVANNFAFAPMKFDPPLQFDERRLVATADPRGNFCALRVQANSQPTRGSLSLTGNVILWDQRPNPPAAHVPGDVMETMRDTFRWAFVGPMTSDEEAAACKVAMPRFDVIESIMNTLRDDGYYEESPHMEEVHARLREQLCSLRNQTPPASIEELADTLTPLGIAVARSEEPNLAQEFEHADPRNAHDQQSLDITSDVNATSGLEADPRTRVQISVSALVDTRAASNGDAMDMAAARLVHRRSDKLRKSKANSLEDLSDAYPDMFGVRYDDGKHQPQVGFAERIRRILNDASGCFQVPEFVLHLFSKYRTHLTDTKAFISAEVMSERHAKAIANVNTADFIARLEEENRRLRQFRANTAGNVDATSQGNDTEHTTTRDANTDILMAHLNGVAHESLGSPQERMRGRAHVYALLTDPIRGGCATYFYTLSVSSDHIVMMHYSGHVAAEVLRRIAETPTTNVPEILKTLSATPIAENRWNIALRSPVASARFLRTILDGFVEEVLRFDRVAQRSYKGGGILGVIEWFFHAVEETGRKQLHVHGVARAASGPKTLSEAERLQENAAETSKLCQFADAILSAELPGSEEPEKCTQCDVELVAEETVPARARFFGVREPYMYHCLTCNKQFTATLLNQLKLQRNKKDLQVAITAAYDGDPEIEEFNVDQYIRAILLGGGQLHIPRDTSSLSVMSQLEQMVYKFLLLRIANSVQMHSASHHSSCTKGSQRTALKDQCRFGMPQDTTPKTILDANVGKVALKRSAANIYLNPFAEVLLPVLKANHDFQLLLGIGGAIALYYVVGYITKSQGRLHQHQVLSLARTLERRKNEERLKEVQPENRDVARRTVSALARATVTSQEIGSNMAAWYILYGSPFDVSHPHVEVYMNQVFAHLDGEKRTGRVVKGKEGKLAVVTHYQHYLNRHHALGRQSMHKVVRERDFRKFTGRAGSTPEGKALRPLPVHPQSNSHAHVQRDKEFVVAPIGDRLPSLERLKDSSFLRRRFAQQVLALFVPHRSAQELAGVAEGTDLRTLADDHWYNRFRTLRDANLLDEEAHNYMEYNEDYYLGRKKGDQLAAEEKAAFARRYEEESIETAVENGHDDVDATIQTEDDLEYANINNYVPDAQLVNGVFEQTLLFETARETLAIKLHDDNIPRCDQEHYAVQQNARAHALSEVTNMNEAPSCNPSAGEARLMLQSGLQQRSPQTPHAARQPISLNDESGEAVSVSVIRDAISPSEEMEVHDADSNSAETAAARINSLPSCPSIHEVSEAFGFDGLQHAAFCCAAIPFLLSLQPQKRNRAIAMIAEGQDGNADREQVQALRKLSEPTVMYIGGEGGCGKSWVEYAIQVLARKWFAEDGVMLTGTTGAAAAAIGGRTIHSIIGYRHRSRRNSEALNIDIPFREANRDRQLSFADVRALVIDEVSMMGQQLCGRIERGISALRGNRAEAQSSRRWFANLPVVVMVGDFQQLPPVRDPTVYRNPLGQNTGNARQSGEASYGKDVWDQSVRKCIILRKNQRASGCHLLRELLTKLRSGAIDETVINTLKSRSLRRPEVREQLKSLYGSYHGDALKHAMSPTIATNNETVQAVNLKMASKAAADGKSVIRLVQEVRPTPRSSTQLSNDFLSQVYSVPASHTSFVDTVLYLILGFPYQCAHNKWLKYGVAKNTWMILRKVCFTGENEMRREYDPVTRIQVEVPSEVPSALIFELVDKRHAIPLEGLPLGFFIMPLTDFGGSIHNPNSEGDGPLTMEITKCKRNVRFLGFPIRLALACTIHNAQGMTFEAACIANMRTRASQPESLYVACSRVRSLERLFFIDTIAEEDVRYGGRGPSEDLDHEMHRLRGVEMTTIHLLNAALPRDEKMKSARALITSAHREEDDSYKKRRARQDQNDSESRVLPGKRRVVDELDATDEPTRYPTRKKRKPGEWWRT